MFVCPVSTSHKLSFAWTVANDERFMSSKMNINITVCCPCSHLLIIFDNILFVCKDKKLSYYFEIIWNHFYSVYFFSNAKKSPTKILISKTLPSFKEQRLMKLPKGGGDEEEEKRFHAVMTTLLISHICNRAFGKPLNSMKKKLHKEIFLSFLVVDI